MLSYIYSSKFAFEIRSHLEFIRLIIDSFESINLKY